MRVKLTKSQQSLFRAWTDDYQRIMGVVGGILNDNMNLRIEKLAEELGVDVEDGTWNFDMNTLEFWQKEDKEKAPEPGSFPGEPEADPVAVPVGEAEVCDAVDTPEAV